jgi:hypothetical protein
MIDIGKKGTSINLDIMGKKKKKRKKERVV